MLLDCVAASADYAILVLIRVGLEMDAATLFYRVVSHGEPAPEAA